MRYIFSIVSLLFFSCVHAQNLNWGVQASGPANEFGKSVYVDQNGNTFVTGDFSGTVDFDPGPGVSNLTSAGGSDVFVAKFDDTGNLVWVKRIGGVGNDGGTAIQVFGASIVIAGFFRNTIDINPGIGIFNYTSFGGEDMFYLELNTTGDYVLSNQLGGTGDDAAFSIKRDDGGNVHTTGVFSGTVDFDPGPATANLTSAGSFDVFVTKSDPVGNFVWARRMGGSGFDFGVSVAVDGGGNVYTTGTFEGTVDFDPGAGTNNHTSAGFDDIFISKLDGAGNFVWANRIGGTGFDNVNSIAVGPDGNLWFTGNFENIVDFDPGPGVSNLTVVGGGDIFVSKQNTTGNLVWVKQMGGTSYESGVSITIHPDGNLWFTGYFNGTVDFDPGAGTFTLTATNEDIFVSHLDPSGNFLWAVKLGGASNENGKSITVDASGKIYVTGSFQGTADFDPGPGVLNLTSAGGNDIFLIKLNQDIVWNGSVSNIWGDPANWNSGIVPDMSSHVIIPSGLARYPTVLITTEIKSLHVQPGAAVNVAPGKELKVNGTGL